MIDKKTMEYFSEQGRIGGNKTKKLYGLKHYQRIGKLSRLSTGKPLVKKKS